MISRFGPRNLLNSSEVFRAGTWSRAVLWLALFVTIFRTITAGTSARPSPPALAPTTLFSDDFSGAFPGTNWIIVNGSPTIDPTTGNPAPGLEFPTTGSPTPTASVQSAVNPFSTRGGLSVSADIGFPSGTTAFTTFVVKDENGSATSAEVYIPNGSTTATYFIDNFFVTQPFNPDNKFHTYTFQVDASGNAAWLRDGVQQASASGFSSNTLIMTFAGGTSSGPTYIDNVRVVGFRRPLPRPSGKTVFYDDFSGSFPGTNWIIVNGSPTIDPNTGNPAPSLEFPMTGSPTPTASIQSAVNPFSTQTGLSVSADIGFPSGTTAFSTFVVKDQNGSATVAEVYIPNGSSIVTYYIGAFSPGVTQPFNPDNNFHTYTLQVDASGNAAWLRDGVEQASGTGFSSNNLILTFAGGTSSGPTYLDNVNVQVWQKCQAETNCR